MTASKQILIATPSLSTIRRVDGTVHQSGIFLSEFGYLFEAARFALHGDMSAITIASHAGGNITIDPISDNLATGEDPAAKLLLPVESLIRSALRETMRIAHIDADQVEAVLLPGGHAAVNESIVGCHKLADIVSRVYARGGMIAAVCHGPAGLLLARKRDGSPLVSGLQLTGFSRDEETAVNLIDEVHNEMGGQLEDWLVGLGAKYSKSPAGNFQPHVIVDKNRQFFTGQNPQSAAPLAKQVAFELRQRLR